jgi:hypothetical protein
MKLFYLSLMVIPFFISCSDTSTTNESSFTSSKISDSLPLNSSNPYDVAGQLHNSLYETYYQSDSLSGSVLAISNRICQLAKEQKSFMSLAGSNFPVLSESRIDFILSDTGVSQYEIIESYLLSTASKTSLSGFIDSVVTLCETEGNYSVIYDFIVSYEASILSDDSFTTEDRKVMLIATSITRHSVYERKKRPKKNRDPEWDLMVGNIVAGIEGGIDSIEKAVLMSLITGIAENSQ